MPTASKKVINGWAMYDWANSAYNLVITTTIFPAYYIAITEKGNEHGAHYVNFFGRNFINTALMDYTLSVVFLLVALCSPILGSIADYRRNKKVWLRLFCTIGSAASIGLFFFYPGKVEYGMIIFAIATLGFWASLVFYNSYLPEIAAPEDQDRVSAKGFSLGYLGSVLLQLICFVLILNPSLLAYFGLNPEDGTAGPRFAFLLVGLWWFGFAQITLNVLPGTSKSERKAKKNVLTNGFHELKLVWKQLTHLPLLKRFLLAFFLYSMGVQTVMLVAAGFAKKEIFPDPNDQGKLMGTMIIIQLVAIIGAIAMSRLSRRIGNLWVLVLAVCIWIGICVAGYFITGQMEFYVLAGVVGLVMGGIQSMSRSTYSKFLPETQDTTSFFSFYDVTEKIAMVIGLFTFGFLEDLTGSMRNSIVALGIFFVLGLLALFYTKKVYDRSHATVHH
ncbi:MFS transporter [Flavihumibacter petaseus]|uniref:Putative major facilitator superfamily transporter n=1 Tax=Flavihumibacter petaseus NBRC 106054 TaxID=1220578 RepID=A0A0E9N5H9_9BACT|nr:MFS transporter [Flavihumibacter petaseus]GAO45063.1 putative major facilitator superfamily transporter [Flavihumibacter petaseus NBRC 106054]